MRTPMKRKRNNMDSSTPISQRREPCLLEMTEDSPIDIDRSSQSSTYSATEDTIPDEKRKAGASNELDSMAVTPPRIESPDTYDRKLALHSMVIAKASNSKIPELLEQESHPVELLNNPFAKRDTAGGDVNRLNLLFGDGLGASRKTYAADLMDCRREEEMVRAVDMDGMNKSPSGGRGNNRAVAMNGMNKTPMRGGRGDNRSVVMNEMNNTPIRGGGEGRSAVDVDGGSGPMGEGMVSGASESRKMKVAARKIVKSSSIGGGTDKKECRIVLGKGVARKILAERACPTGYSPKRAIPMDVDPPTPKMKKRKNSERKFDTKQKLITEVWKKTGDGV